jgi:hypothetical protein
MRGSVEAWKGTRATGRRQRKAFMISKPKLQISIECLHNDFDAMNRVKAGSVGLRSTVMDDVERRAGAGMRLFAIRQRQLDSVGFVRLCL